MLTLKRLVDLDDLVKWNNVFIEAGLNPNTMRSAKSHGRELRSEEAEAILRALANRGIRLSFNDQAELFDT